MIVKSEYDAQGDALYLRFRDAVKRVTTQELTDDISIDFDSKGRVTGIEILSASSYFDKEQLCNPPLFTAAEIMGAQQLTGDSQILQP